MGDATARLFAKEGASVIVADIKEQEAERVARAIRDADSSHVAHAMHVQVTDEKSVQELAQSVANRFGGADILVNTFGVADFVPAAQIGYDAWKSTVEVNLSGTYLTCRAFGMQMIERRRGKIVNFGSTASLSGVPGMVHYTAAKHGVLGLTRALAVEWGKYNINVNCICPGATTTPLMLNATTDQWRRDRVRRIPLGRMGTPEEQAMVALFLASDESSYVTGCCITTDGGVVAMAAATSDDALARE